MLEPATVAEFDISPDDAIRADIHVRADFGTGSMMAVGWIVLKVGSFGFVGRSVSDQPR